MMMLVAQMEIYPDKHYVNDSYATGITVLVYLELFQCYSSPCMCRCVCVHIFGSGCSVIDYVISIRLWHKRDDLLYKRRLIKLYDGVRSDKRRVHRVGNCLLTFQTSHTNIKHRFDM